MPGRPGLWHNLLRLAPCTGKIFSSLGEELGKLQVPRPMVFPKMRSLLCVPLFPQVIFQLLH